MPLGRACPEFGDPPGLCVRWLGAGHARRVVRHGTWRLRVSIAVDEQVVGAGQQLAATATVAIFLPRRFAIRW